MFIPVIDASRSLTTKRRIMSNIKCGNNDNKRYYVTDDGDQHEVIISDSEDQFAFVLANNTTIHVIAKDLSKRYIGDDSRLEFEIRYVPITKSVLIQGDHIEYRRTIIDPAFTNKGAF